LTRALEIGEKTAPPLIADVNITLASRVCRPMPRRPRANMRAKIGPSMKYAMMKHAIAVSPVKCMLRAVKMTTPMEKKASRYRGLMKKPSPAAAKRDTAKAVCAIAEYVDVLRVDARESGKMTSGK